MTDLRTAAQQALEALEFYYDQHGEESDAKVITALRDALATPEERNFCPRCGKRANDIHTCTPP